MSPSVTFPSRPGRFAARALLDAFWRAAAYCVHPKVILLSLAPLVVCGGTVWLLGYFYWEAAVAGTRATLDGWAVFGLLAGWLDAIGAGGFRGVLAPLVVVALALPVIVVASLLLVAALMAPAIVRLVAARRFPTLEKRRGGGLWHGFLASLGWTAIALVALVVSLPLWLIPPLALLLPPLVWGWLTCRVLSFDVLAEHASADERRAIVRAHRWPLLGMGIASGYLGAAPSLLWGVSAFALVLAPLLVVVAVWLYTLVFAFTALWFAHYSLAALQALRAAVAAPAAASPAVLPSLDPPPPVP